MVTGVSRVFSTKRIAVLMTCHNRKEMTLSCLKALFQCFLPTGYSIRVLLVDDGSFDNTAVEVSSLFPEVLILRGNGSLYWNGGMRLAFQEAMNQGYDYYLWLNDDVQLYNDAIERLINTTCDLNSKLGKDSIIVGSVQDQTTALLTYGGNKIRGWYAPLSFERIEPQDIPLECDAINGNCVLVTNKIAQRVGNLSAEFTHDSGDYDYSLRAKKLGFPAYIAPGFVGTCSQNTISGTWRDKKLTIEERKEMLKKPTSLTPAKEWMIFTRRHAGVFWPFYWARTFLRSCWPQLLLFFRSKKSE